ncbi:hypothetical protein THARTR1_03888 [Trichoderma harzianum]|uniref:BTB domain-containing protein n=1 Tax=Trichoderma harzianum TaxID=5544 RepID=A0A2K0UDU4_TRIHA|nr:hypothetical protein THARTR1_03888 [Trichoderma harzianum]
MHEAAITRLSKTLDKLVNGGMKESQEHCVCWEDIDETTFLRFGEWAYTGDYKPEEPEILLDASQIAISKRATKKPNASKPETVATSLASFKEPDETWSHCASTSTYNRNNTESCEDYSGVFLSHARLYVLADKYDIKQLRDLSAHKVWATLKEFTLYPERMGDVVGLVRYAFQNTLEKDKLRALLKDFCACIVEDLCKGQGFQDLICETPEFACPNLVPLSIVFPKGPNDKVPPVRTQARSATILPNFVGLNFEIHNGKDYHQVTITEDMVGHKLGEFAP